MPDLDAIGIAVVVVALIVSIILHEVAHGVVANAFGDHTARDAGRLTLNPIPHIDPFGTVLLPGLLLALSAAGVGGGVVFGYAKPVPIDVAKLGRSRFRMMAVAGAGPLVNGVLAVGAALVLRAIAPTTFRIAESILLVVVLNAVLFVFNLIPIPPLDGSKIVAWALPAAARRVFLRLEQYGFALLLVLIFLVPGGLGFIVEPLVDRLLRAVLV